MRKTIVGLGLLFLISCGNNDKQISRDELSKSKSDTETTEASLLSSKNIEKVNTVSASNGEGLVRKLSAEEFKSLVFDYEANKEWKFQGKKPCIVDFYADWCGPCKIVAPRLAELAKEYEGQIDIYKVNTDEQRTLSGVFQIRGIPAILYCPVSGQPQMSTGALPKSEYKKVIDEFLLKNN